MTPDLPRLLDGLGRDAGRPRITWYGADERVELSGTVLLNWVTKTTNLLVEELDAAPGTRVLLDLPPRWRLLTWAPAVWRSGACVVLADDAGPVDRRPVDVVVTDRPDRHATGTPVVAVASPVLARSWPGDLPPGALDAAAAVMTYGDTLGWVPPTDATAPALVAPAGAVTHGDLVRRSVDEAGSVADGARVLLDVSRTPGRTSAAAATLHQALAVWAHDGSLVLVDAALGEDALDRIRRTERVGADATS